MIKWHWVLTIYTIYSVRCNHKKLTKQSLYIQITIAAAAEKKNTNKKQNKQQPICFAIATVKNITELCLDLCYHNMEYTQQMDIYIAVVNVIHIIRILHFAAEFFLQKIGIAFFLSV